MAGERDVRGLADTPGGDAPGAGIHRAETPTRHGGEPGAHDGRFGESARSGLIERIRSRLSSLFGHDDQADPRLALRDRIEQESYHASLRDAQRRFRDAVETDPALRQHRQDAATALAEGRQAAADQAAHRSAAQSSRSHEQHGRDQAQQLRERADRATPGDVAPEVLRQHADQWDRHADQMARNAAHADTQAAHDAQRLADAHTRYSVANRQADEITKNASRRYDMEKLWRSANVEIEKHYDVVDENHPGPDVSALTGRDVPPPVWRNRPHDVEHGLRRVLHSDQARLEQALGDGRGGYQRAADPKGPWLRLINAFAAGFDPTRTQNCLDTVASLFDTFVHGRPTVAAPRTFDGYARGAGDLPAFGEAGGPGRMEDLTGARYQALVGDVSQRPEAEAAAQVNAAFEQIRQQLLDGGHGSFASIITGWRGDGSHAWAAVNFEGKVHFIDPQSGRLVVAEDTPTGIRYVNPHTGREYDHPIYDPARITRLDVLAVDHDAAPMAFGDRPPGTWNERPLTDHYLSHQPADEQAAQATSAAHTAAQSARDQATSNTTQAHQARQAEQGFATDARIARAQALDAANRAAMHTSQRDAAWREADQRQQQAAQHDAAAHHHAQREQHGTPAERHQAGQLARDRQAAADRARLEESQLRNQAYQQDALRQQAELTGQRATETARVAEVRRQDAAQAAQRIERVAQADEQRAAQLESHAAQQARQAAVDHDQQAARYRNEAQQHWQDAAKRAQHDPVRAVEEERARHFQRLADAAAKARDHYDAAYRREATAEQAEQRAQGHDQQAEWYRRQADQQEQAAQWHEQNRAAAEARAGRLDHHTDPDGSAARQHRDQAAAFERARDDAAARAARDRIAEHNERTAAQAERASGVADRNAMRYHQDQAAAWHRDVRAERLAEPGADATPGPVEFSPDKLRPDLRARYEALHDEGARNQFDRMYRDNGGDQDRLARALDGMHRGAVKQGTTVERMLADRYHAYEEARAAELSGAASPDLPQPVTDEIRTQLQHAEQVRAKIDEYARNHPEVRGVEKWQSRLKDEEAPLRRDLRWRAASGGKEPTTLKAESHGNNIRGLEAEIDLADRSSGVVEVNKDVQTKTPDGRSPDSEMDVVSDGGRVWKDVKNYTPFSVRSSDFRDATEQVRRQLEIAAHNTAYHVDGQPPRLEWHYTRGVDPDVARQLEAIRIKDPVTGLDLPHHVTVVGDRVPVGGHESPPAGGSPPDAPHGSAPSEDLGAGSPGADQPAPEASPGAGPGDESAVTRTEQDRGVAEADRYRTVAQEHAQAAAREWSAAEEHRQQARVEQTEAQRHVVVREAHERAAGEFAHRRDDALQEAAWHDQNAARHDEAARAASGRDPQRAAGHQRWAEWERHQAAQAREHASALDGERARAEQGAQDAGRLERQHAERHAEATTESARAESAAAEHQRQVLDQDETYLRQVNELTERYRSVAGTGEATGRAAEHYEQAAIVHERTIGHEHKVERDRQLAVDRAEAVRRHEAQAWEHHRAAERAEDTARLLEERAAGDTRTAAALRTVEDPAYRHVAERLEATAGQARRAAAEHRQLAADQARLRDEAQAAADQARQGEGSAREQARQAAEAAAAARRSGDGWHDKAARWHGFHRDVETVLSANDIAAVVEYGGPGHESVNSFLRDGVVSGDTDAAGLLDRADAVSTALAKLPTRAGTTHRGVDFSADVLARYEPGRVVVEKGFLSTSTDSKVADRFGRNTLIVVTGEGGHDLGTFPVLQREGEVLYDKGTHFLVTGKTWDEAHGKWIITLREVPPHASFEGRPDLPSEHGGTSLDDAVFAAVRDVPGAKIPAADGPPADVVGEPRYTVETPQATFADTAQRLLDDLAGRGYHPVELTDGWRDGGPGGLESRWRDPATGHEFTVRLEPDARMLRALDPTATRLPMPEGLDRVHLPHPAGDAPHPPSHGDPPASRHDQVQGQPPPDPPGGPADFDHGHSSGHDLFTRHAPRTNIDVLDHGGGLERTPETVEAVAEQAGVDLDGVDVYLVQSVDEARYLDYWDACAVTPVEMAGRQIRLGPASFADAETLAATLAHERTHVAQLRAGAEVGTGHLLEDLETEAYASEVPALERFRQHQDGGWAGDADPVRDRADIRPADAGGTDRVGTDAERLGPGGNDIAGSDDWRDGPGDRRGADHAAGGPPGSGGDHPGPAGRFGADGGQDADRGLSFPTADPPLAGGLPGHPDAVFRELHERCATIAEEQLHLAESLEGDGKYWFAKVYHHVTAHELQMIDEGRYTYPIMKMQEVVAFHETYRANLDAWLHGRIDEVEPNWRQAFQAAEEAAGQWRPLPSMHVMDALLPSMQAHIRFDLPRAIASVYEHYYADTGIPFEAFKPDFDRMQPVFDEASADLRPEIADHTFPGDPGQYEFVQEHGFKLIFDVPRERLYAWEKAGWIVAEHAAGVTDQATMQSQLARYSRTFHPFGKHSDYRIGGHHIDTYDWNHQPGLDHPAPLDPAPPGGTGPDGGGTPAWLSGDDHLASGAAGPGEVRRLEQALGRELFTDPGARDAADRALRRLVDAMAALNPDQPRHAIESVLFGDDYRNAGQVSAGSTTLESVHQQGNLRMLMTSFYNGVLESHHPLDLNNTLRRVLLEDGWREKLGEAGLDVEALAPLRERLLAAPERSVIDTAILAGDHGHARLLAAEHRASQGARYERPPDERVPHLKTRRDYAELGVPLHPDEYDALRGHDALTLTVNGEPRLVNPRAHDLRPGEVGPELPLRWIDGAARYGMKPEHAWYREVVDERGLPVAAGISGSAARLLAAFHWLRVPEVEQASFLHALMGWMLPAGDHSLYEIVRGAQLVEPGLFGEPGQGFADFADLLHRIPGLTDHHLADIAHRADELTHPAPAHPPAVGDSLADAAEVRDGLGGMDDTGLRRLLDGLPSVPGLAGHPTTYSLAQLLHHGGPDGSPGAAHRAALLSFAADSLGRPAGDLSLDRVGGDGGAKGASGAPVFWVRDGAGERIGVVKVFPKPEEFARELSALQRLHAESFERLAVPEVRGLGVARADDASAGVLISSVAAGRPLDDLMVAARDAPPEGRAAAVAELGRAYRDTGAALAEMHERPLGSGGPVAEWFPDRFATARAVDSLHEWAGHEPFQRMFGFDGDAVMRRFAELGDAAWRDPGGGALVHGDPHPGNFFHDPATGRVTIIDLEGMHSSIDGDGRPVGIAALDVGVFEQVSSAFAHNFGVAPLLPELQRSFFEGYQQASGHPLPEAALRYYRASGLALALHGTRRMLFGEAPHDASITPENLARRAHEQLTQIQRLLGLDEPPSAGARDITASEVTNSRFHGYARDAAAPEAVTEAGAAALRDTVARIPADSPARQVRFEVTSVPAEELPGRAVARTVPLGDGHYRIELSDRAAHLDIPRAVAHEVAEVGAIEARGGPDVATGLPDALHGGDFADGAELSPHDLGRLAEAEVLTRQMHDGTLPLADRVRARDELGHLIDHLGLHPDDPGAPHRLALADPHLSDAARSAVGDVRTGRSQAAVREFTRSDHDHPSGVPPWLTADPAERPDAAAGQPPQELPTPRLRVLAFAGPGETPLLDGLVRELGGVGDGVVLRQPHPHVPARDLGPQVRIEAVEQLPGVTGELSPLLRLDGLPADVDVIIGYGKTAGIADLRLDAYPEARVVQVLDSVPVDRQHLEVLARADLILAADPEVAHRTRALLDDLGLDGSPPVGELPAGGGPELHHAILGIGGRVARVDDAAWHAKLSPREVVLRRAGEPVPPPDGPPRVMTTFVAWSSEHGGGATANRELAASFTAAGAEVYARVPDTGDPTRQAFTDPVTGAHVVGARTVWGVTDARALLMLPDNLPPHVDVVVGHSRFSGGASVWLAEHVYPDARYVHVLHSLPEQLDALRGTPAEGVEHAQTERVLMGHADLVVGVGPLLAIEAARLSGGPPPPIHTMISDMPRAAGEPPQGPSGQHEYHLLVQGRLDDPLKGVQFLSRVVGTLQGEGLDVRLVARGAPAHLVEAQAQQLSTIAGEGKVEVRPRTTNTDELVGDIYGVDMVVMPSVHEGFGLVASEAARAGVPVFVGEGTGAGLYFGDATYVPVSLGEPAVVRDGVTVQAVWDALAQAPDPRSAVAHLDNGRLPVWVEHVRQALENLPAHRQRALDLRAFLDERYHVGSAARALLDQLGFGPSGADAGPSPLPGPVTGHATAAGDHGSVARDLAGAAAPPREAGQVQSGGTGPGR